MNQETNTRPPTQLYFRISGVIPSITNPERNIYYMACKICRRKLVELPDNKFSCESCQLISRDGQAVYNFSCILMDYTDSVIISVIGNEIGETIMGCPPALNFKPRLMFK